MNWRNTLRLKTRQPAFLWRMVLGMLAVGVVLGYVAEKVWLTGASYHQQPIASQAAWENLKSLSEQYQWRQLWWALPRVAYGRFSQLGPTGLAVLGGCCWFAFLVQAIEVRSHSKRRLGYLLLALPLGVLSIWPTHFMNFWQEQVWNLRPSRELIQGIRYYVFSVGLREELAKLSCLLPLMPWLLRERNELVAMLVSAGVGLGFAFAENVGYFYQTAGSSTLGRFLMANPLHMTLTGLIGLAVYRGFRYPRDWGIHALAVFGIAVIAHGMYDACIDLPAFGEYSLLSIVIFALVIYQFFAELRSLRSAKGEVISLSATFLFGVSLLLATTFVYLSATQSFSLACDVLMTGALAQAVMVYLFLREMPESMVSV